MVEKYIGFDENNQAMSWGFGGKGPKMSPLAHMCNVSLLDVVVKKDQGNTQQNTNGIALHSFIWACKYVGED